MSAIFLTIIISSGIVGAVAFLRGGSKSDKDMLVAYEFDIVESISKNE